MDEASEAAAVLENVWTTHTHAHNRSNHLCTKYVPLVFHSEFYMGHLKREKRSPTTVIVPCSAARNEFIGFRFVLVYPGVSYQHNAAIVHLKGTTFGTIGRRIKIAIMCKTVSGFIAQSLQTPFAIKAAIPLRSLSLCDFFYVAIRSYEVTKLCVYLLLLLAEFHTLERKVRN